MVEIDPHQVSPALVSLFDPSGPTALRCLAVLAGGNAGRILTDDASHPAWGVVWEADDGTMYLGGSPSSQVVRRAVAVFRREGNVLFGFRERNAQMDLFPPVPDAAAMCLEFDRSLDTAALAGYLDRLPEGFTVHRMDRTRLESSPHCAASVIRYGSLENFLDKGLGMCVLHGQIIVSESYADMSVGGVREIGVTTQEAYRGQGLATISCAHLIRICAELGDRTYWDCAKHNPASAAVARKLGFGSEREYHLVAWFKSKPQFPPARITTHPVSRGSEK